MKKVPYLFQEKTENNYKEKIFNDDLLFYSPPSCSRIICRPIEKKRDKRLIVLNILPSSFFNGFKRF